MQPMQGCVDVLNQIDRRVAPSRTSGRGFDPLVTELEAHESNRRTRSEVISFAKRPSDDSFPKACGDRGAGAGVPQNGSWFTARLAPFRSVIILYCSQPWFILGAALVLVAHGSRGSVYPG